MDVTGVVTLLITIYCFTILPRALYMRKYLKEYDRYVLNTIKRRKFTQDLLLFLPITGCYMTFQILEQPVLKYINVSFSAISFVWLIASLFGITINDTFFAYYSIVVILFTVVLTIANCCYLLHILGGEGLVFLFTILPPVAYALAWHYPRVFLHKYADELRGTFQ